MVAPLAALQYFSPAASAFEATEQIVVNFKCIVVMCIIMPIVAISVAQAAAGLAALEPDLDYLLCDRGVGKEVRALRGHFAIARANVIAKIAGTEAAVRTWLEDDFLLNKV